MSINLVDKPIEIPLKDVVEFTIVLYSSKKAQKIRHKINYDPNPPRCKTCKFF